MSGTEKAEVLAKVASSGLPERETLGELGLNFDSNVSSCSLLPLEQG